MYMGRFYVMILRTISQHLQLHLLWLLYKNTTFLLTTPAHSGSSFFPSFHPQPGLDRSWGRGFILFLSLFSVFLIFIPPYFDFDLWGFIFLRFEGIYFLGSGE